MPVVRPPLPASPFFIGVFNACLIEGALVLVGWMIWRFIL